jgi:hypothetical protein
MVQIIVAILLAVKRSTIKNHAGSQTPLSIGSHDHVAVMLVEAAFVVTPLDE